MLIIRDYDLPAWAPGSRDLGLSGNELTLDGNIPALGREELVCFLTGLGNGGKAHHIQLILSNPQVKRWVVVLFSGDADAVAQYREYIIQTGAFVRWVIWSDNAKEELRRILENPGEKHCLIYGKYPHPGLRELAGHLGSALPDWQFSVASDCPEVLRSGWSHLILAGTKAEDYMLELPDSLVRIPFFVLLHAQDAVQAAIHPGDLILQIAEFFPKTFRWNRQRLSERFFVTNVLYEEWYSFCRNHPENIPMLRNDPRLTIWDRFGLPLPVDRVSDREMLSFLGSFTGCADLAATLEQCTKG